MISSLLFAFVSAPLLVSYDFQDITPKENLPLGGYTERKDKLMDGIGERLSARMLRIQQGQTDVAIIAAEMLTIPGSLAEEVAQEAAKYGERPVLLLAATHTHCAPDSQMLNRKMRMKVPGIAVFNSKQFEWYAEQLSKTLYRSEDPKSLERVTVFVGEADANRSRAEGAPPIKTVTEIRFETRTANYTVLNYAAHPTLRDAEFNQTSGDWPGAWMGWQTPRLFLQGAAGDVSPAPPGNARGDAGIAEMKTALEAAKKSSRTFSASRLGTLKAVRIAVTMPAVTPHPKFAERNGVPEALAKIVVSGFAPDKADVTLIRLGPIAFIGIPGEPSSAVGRRVLEKARAAGIEYPVVVSFANEWLGYILTAEEYALGEYEATLSFHGPTLADEILKAFERALAAAK